MGLRCDSMVKYMQETCVTSPAQQKVGERRLIDQRHDLHKFSFICGLSFQCFDGVLGTTKVFHFVDVSLFFPWLFVGVTCKKSLPSPRLKDVCMLCFLLWVYNCSSHLDLNVTDGVKSGVQFHSLLVDHHLL